MALLVIAVGVMAVRRRFMRSPMTVEDLITLTGHMSGLVVAAYILAFVYKDVDTGQMAPSLGVATSAGGLIWGFVSLVGAYRLIWTPVAPKDVPPVPPAPPS